ncbi:hypothetical protein KQX54_018079 [Cotesia glomerata]|uniref:Uncharacterized protein n=1 Tax=Cotesia glomerata TaxID=32391 RepID=A0AAV7HX10_COTGL|nr:hypothetical protein KQX54_018079 [Cotesia glomerata]
MKVVTSPLGIIPVRCYVSKRNIQSVSDLYGFAINYPPLPPVNPHLPVTPLVPHPLAPLSIAGVQPPMDKRINVLMYGRSTGFAPISPSPVDVIVNS